MGDRSEQMLRQSGRENGPTFDQALGAISDQAQRIAQIVDRVRAYDRHQPLAKTPCVLADIVQAMLENFRMVQNSACTVSVEVAGNIRVVADPVALELLLLNLVRNAARAAAKTGEGKNIHPGADPRAVGADHHFRQRPARE